MSWRHLNWGCAVCVCLSQDNTICIPIVLKDQLWFYVEIKELRPEGWCAYSYIIYVDTQWLKDRKYEVPSSNIGLFHLWCLDNRKSRSKAASADAAFGNSFLICCCFSSPSRSHRAAPSVVLKDYQACRIHTHIQERLVQHHLRAEKKNNLPGRAHYYYFRSW